MKYSNAGFTLIELMAAVILAGILLAVAAPSFRSTLQNNRVTTQANQLVAALNAARSEAIDRGGDVTLCSSSDLATCAGASNWANGWIMFTDGGTAGTVDGSDTVLRRWPALQGGTTLTGPANVQYQALGQVVAGGSFQASIRDCTGDHARSIVVSISGVVSVSSAACP